MAEFSDCLENVANPKRRWQIMFKLHEAIMTSEFRVMPATFSEGLENVACSVEPAGFGHFFQTLGNHGLMVKKMKG